MERFCQSLYVAQAKNGRTKIKADDNFHVNMWSTNLISQIFLKRLFICPCFNKYHIRINSKKLLPYVYKNNIFVSFHRIECAIVDTERTEFS